MVPGGAVYDKDSKHRNRKWTLTYTINIQDNRRCHKKTRVMITTDISRPQMPSHLVYSVIWVQHIICIFITHRVMTKDLIDKIAGCFWTPMDVPWKNKRLEIKLSSVLSGSVVSNSLTQWTVARQAPLSMGILQARILEWFAMPSSRDLPNPEIEPRSPALQVDSLLSKLPGKPRNKVESSKIKKSHQSMDAAIRNQHP